MKDICAVIVTYNPDSRLLVNCALLQRQVGAIVIVDNGSEEKVEQAISTAGLSGIIVIHNTTNVGLAAALNIGIRYAQDKYRWILTFDQDSIITDSYVRYMIEAHDAYTINKTLAIVVPFYKDQTTGTIQSFRNHKVGENELYATATTANTSGNLISAHIFDKVGLFREDFFIDYIDNEFCLRCRKKGYNIIESTKACLLHNVGAPRVHALFWKRPLASNHSPLRRYYIARNRYVVYRSYLFQQPQWVLHDLYLAAKEIVKILLYEQDVLYKYSCMLRGLWHGIIGRMGPLPVIPAR